MISDLRIKKTPGALGKTLSKSDLEDPDNINKYRAFVGRLMCYTTKVGPDLENSHYGIRNDGLRNDAPRNDE